MERLTYEKCLNRWDGGKHPTKYTSRHTFQEVVARPAAYEDFMERWKLTSIEEAERIFRRVNALGGTDLMAQYRDLGPLDHLRELAQAEKDGRLVVLPPNDPFTLDELREMDGEPVWVEQPGYGGKWALVNCWWKSHGVIYLTYFNGAVDLIEPFFANGGKAYRRKPEEGKLIEEK